MKFRWLLYIILFSVFFSLFSCQNVTASKIDGFPNKSTKKLKQPTKFPKGKGVNGYCCEDGKITETMKINCKKGSFYKTKQRAKKNCFGFCCENGKVEKASEETCEKDHGFFYGNKTDAESRCARDRGFCCKTGVISKSTKGDCKDNNGVFDHLQSILARKCRGLCCLENGKILKLNRQKCNVKNGDFFTSSRLAEQKCKKKKRYCLLDGKITQLTENECTQKGGHYFNNRTLAGTALLKKKVQKRKKIKGVLPDNKLKVALHRVHPLATSLPGKKNNRIDKLLINKIDPDMKNQYGQKIIASKNQDKMVTKEGHSNHGINITSPTEGDSFAPGDTIHVDFTLERSLGNPLKGVAQFIYWPGRFEVIIEKQIGPWVGSTNPSNDDSLFFRIPLDAPTGQYKVVIALYNTSPYAEGGDDVLASGMSHFFQVEAENIDRGIQVVEPTIGTNFHPGDNLIIEFNYTGGLTASDLDHLTLSLYNNEGLNFTLSANHDPNTNRITFTVPRTDITDNSFRVRVESGAIYGISNPFTIVADESAEVEIPTDDSISTTTETLRVSTSVYRYAETPQEIKISVEPTRDDQVIQPLRRIRLISEGHTYYQMFWPPGTGPTAGFRSSVEWNITVENDWPRSFYQVEVVETGDSGLFGTSDEFAIWIGAVPEYRRSVGCNGGGNNFSVIVPSGNIMQDGTIPVYWTPLASCSVHGSVYIWLHKKDTPYSLGNVRYELNHEEREVGSRFSQELSFPSSWVEEGEEYIITIYGNSNYNGHSNPFLIHSESGEQDFRLITPYAGLRVDPNGNNSVSWTVPANLDAGSAQPLASFVVELLKDNSVVAQLDARSYRYNSSTKVCTIPWEIPADILQSNHYQIKVKARPVDRYAHDGIYVALSGEFSIGDYRNYEIGAVTSPSAGRTLYTTQIQEITFETLNGRLTPQIWLCDATHHCFLRIAKGYGDETISDGRYNWRVGTGILSEGGRYDRNYCMYSDVAAYKILVKGPPGNYLGEGDYSYRVLAESGLFHIKNPTMTMSQPTMGDSWSSGSIHQIMWNPGQVQGHVRIELWQEGSKIRTIEEDWPQRHYNWEVDNYGAGRDNFHIRVISRECDNILAESGAFSIR